jgi:hypothetical protein
MARNSPVRIWVIKHNPRRDPKFHHTEILDGVGRSTSASLAIFISGWCKKRVVYSLLRDFWTAANIASK